MGTLYLHPGLNKINNYKTIRSLKANYIFDTFVLKYLQIS